MKEVVGDRDFYRVLVDTFMENIEEMSSAHEVELITLRAELYRRGLAPLAIEAKYV